MVDAIASEEPTAPIDDAPDFTGLKTWVKSSIDKHSNECRDRPDIAALLGPTIESARSAQFDGGARMGVAVTFKQSGLRYAVKVDKGIDAIAELREYIAEYPYGRNHGNAWGPRNG